MLKNAWLIHKLSFLNQNFDFLDNPGSNSKTEIIVFLFIGFKHIYTIYIIVYYMYILYNIYILFPI